jgi:hypothetical protein
MSLKEEIDVKYPYLEDDLYTSNMAKELLAKYLDSYLHFLTYLDPSIQVRIIKTSLFVSVRKSADVLLGSSRSRGPFGSLVP